MAPGAPAKLSWREPWPGAQHRRLMPLVTLRLGEGLPAPNALQHAPLIGCWFSWDLSKDAGGASMLLSFLAAPCCHTMRSALLGLLLLHVADCRGPAAAAFRRARRTTWRDFLHEPVPRICSGLLAYLLPAYQTFKAIEKRTPDVTEWAQYW